MIQIMMVVGKVIVIMRLIKIIGENCSDVRGNGRDNGSGNTKLIVLIIVEIMVEMMIEIITCNLRGNV
jgi:hypothetical protein